MFNLNCVLILILYILVVNVTVSEMSGWGAKYIFEGWTKGVGIRTLGTLIVIVYTKCVPIFRFW